jgi:5-methylcytosine-specific restriction endonuclease McrA
MTDQFTIQKSTYYEGLEDPQWKSFRKDILERDGHKCRICGGEKELQVHHRQYHRYICSGEWLKPWEYHPVFLVTLCGTCHRQGHIQYSIPIKDILKSTKL